MRPIKLAGGVAATAAETLVVLALVVSGCGKPGAPPPGAPQDASAPTLEKGTEIGPQETPAASPDSSPGAGSPQAEQGAPK
jgi:hypothetical protein